MENSAILNPANPEGNQKSCSSKFSDKAPLYIYRFVNGSTLTAGGLLLSGKSFHDKGSGKMWSVVSEVGCRSIRASIVSVSVLKPRRKKHIRQGGIELPRVVYPLLCVCCIACRVHNNPDSCSDHERNGWPRKSGERTT